MAEDVSYSVTDQMFDLNTLGPIKLTKAALPHLLSRKKGRIVVIASMAAKVPTPGQAIYSGEWRLLSLGSKSSAVAGDVHCNTEDVRAC
jgi:short-subunit dehydrogenase